MLFEIENKIYVLSSGYYKEVTISKRDTDKYLVTAKVNGSKIEKVHNVREKTISLAEAFKKYGVTSTKVNSKIDE